MNYSNELVLYYNDDFEELNKFGLFKYFVYPVIKGYYCIKEKLFCCCCSRNLETNEIEEFNEQFEDEESYG